MSASASEIETTVFNLFLTREFQCAATALMVYDYLLTLDREITFFWYYAGRWTVPRILFFVNRYFALFAICLNTSALASTAITKHLREPIASSYVLYITNYHYLGYEWIHFLVVTFDTLEIFIIQLILITRLYAMYSRNKMLLYILSLLWVLCAVAAVTIAVLSVKNNPSTNEPIPRVIICASVIPPKNIWPFWIPILVLESILFLLAIHKSIQHVLRNPLGETLTTKIFRIFLRDSAVYYLAILVAYMVNAFIWRFGAPSLLNLFNGMTLSFLSIAGGRMLINFRERGALEEKEQWRNTTGNNSIRFAKMIFAEEEMTVF